MDTFGYLGQGFGVALSPYNLVRLILGERFSTDTDEDNVYTRAAGLLRQWIESLPGPPVLPPPEISPHGGNFSKLVQVVLKSEPGAKIYYTLDGTVPTTSDLLYKKPVQLAGPTILRAKAFKPDFTRSITTQEIFLVGQ